VGKICLLELQIPCCDVLSATPLFERETEGFGNNKHELLYSGVFQCFVYELSALFCTPLLDVHIENALVGIWDTMYPLVAPRELLEKCFILTDSLCLIKAMLSRRISWRTHPLIYECKQLCFDLMKDLSEVKLMWILSHLGLVGNKLVDREALFIRL
jgi:hypothetical protein